MIVLMRHARTVGGRGRCIGRTDLPLSEEGVDQAQRAARRMEPFGFVRLCASPARRARATIAPLAERLGLEPDILPGLDEIDMGAWDGLPFEEIRIRFPEAYARRGEAFAAFRPPRGESFADVAERAMSVLRDLSAGPQPVLAVTHAGVLRSVLCRLTGHPLDDLFYFSPDYTTSTVINSGPDGPELVATGVSPRLLFMLLLHS